MKRGFFERGNKIDKPLTRLKRKGEKRHKLSHQR